MPTDNNSDLEVTSFEVPIKMREAVDGTDDIDVSFTGPNEARLRCEHCGTTKDVGPDDPHTLETIEAFIIEHTRCVAKGG